MRGAVHMAAALAGCRKALVGTGWAISLLFDTMGVDIESTLHGGVGWYQKPVEFSKSVTIYFDVQLNESFSV